MRQRSTDAERSLAGQLAAHTSWQQTTDRSARTAPARAALEARFERMVPPEITGEARIKAVANARAAYYARLALASSKARRLKAAARDAGMRHVSEGLAQVVDDLPNAG